MKGDLSSLPPGCTVGMSAAEALAGVTLAPSATDALAGKTTKTVGRGIHKRGEMNKTERAFADYLDLRKSVGEVLWWMYEPCGLRLAPKTFYHPDFMVMLSNGEIELVDVKGHWEDDARVKIKVAAEVFPFRFIAAKKIKGGWAFEYFGAVV